METCPICRKEGYPRPVSAGRAERVRELAEDALARADAARAGLDGLLEAVERLRAALAGPADDVAPAPRTTVDTARLAAIEMAVAGHGRAEVARHLHESYGGPDVELVLDDVFGAQAQERGASSL